MPRMQHQRGHAHLRQPPVTSMLPDTSMMRAAISGVVVRRCSSQIHSTCSSLAFGMSSSANMRRKAAVPAPQPTRTISVIACPARNDSGERLAQPRAKPPWSTMWLTRSGWRTAYSMACAAPCEMPNKANRSSPAAAAICSRSSTWRSKLRFVSTRSESPLPRWS
jgi:hypothetical protein